MCEVSGGDGSLSSMTVEAILRSGGLETRYHRAGAGRAVLLLAEGVFPAACADRLVPELSGRFRVIRPRAPDPRPPHSCQGAASTSAWIRGLVDGLGIGPCAIVAEGPFCFGAAWFAFSDPLRTTHLVLLVPEAPDPAAPFDEVSRVLAPAGPPMMLLRNGPGEEPATSRILERLVRFLEAPLSREQGTGPASPGSANRL